MDAQVTKKRDQGLPKTTWRPSKAIKALSHELRQLQYPPEFRIRRNKKRIRRLDGQQTTAPLDSAPVSESSTKDGETDRSHELKEMSELAVCLWYLKSKFFRKPWADMENNETDARSRKAMSRINSGIRSLENMGFKVYDPEKTKFPIGGEGMMRPIDFQPVAGLTYDMVLQTVSPVIFYEGVTIRRGEVFVGVPLVDRSTGSASDCAPNAS